MSYSLSDSGQRTADSGPTERFDLSGLESVLYGASPESAYSGTPDKAAAPPAPSDSGSSPR
ncbi:hypothetical protein [Streptomyces sp. NPDC004284]|uniref:hypothetical protein n=1 Tax=Streptomyces sp. NPDC004284 TaxID=3364695 RepID=UPI003695C802